MQNCFNNDLLFSILIILLLGIVLQYHSKKDKISCNDLTWTREFPFQTPM